VLGLLQEGIVKKEALFLSDEAWKHLGSVSTLRGTSSGIHKIHISHISIFFPNLKSASDVLLHERETYRRTTRNTRIAKIGRNVCGILWKFNPATRDAAHASFNA
jgi:hypothetical protein